MTINYNCCVFTGLGILVVFLLTFFFWRGEGITELGVKEPNT